MSRKVCTEFRTHTCTNRCAHVHVLYNAMVAAVTPMCCVMIALCLHIVLLVHYVFIFYFQFYDFPLFSSSKIMKWYTSLLALFIHWNEEGFMFWIPCLLFLLCRVNCCWHCTRCLHWPICYGILFRQLWSDIGWWVGLALEGMKWFIYWCFQHHKL